LFHDTEYRMKQNSQSNYLMSLKSTLLGWLLLMGLVQFTWAAPPLPPLLWRVDSRPPETIFSTGFVALGNNTSMLDHVSGRFNDSGFVAATEQRETARAFAQLMYLLNPSYRGSPLYIYQIRPQNNAYSVVNYLRSMATGGASSPVTANRAREFLGAYGSQFEWASTGAILASQIQSATAVTLTQGDVVEGATSVNRAYVTANTSANSNPYTPPDGSLPAAPANLLTQSRVGQTLLGLWLSLSYCVPRRHDGRELRAAEAPDACDNPATWTPNQLDRLIGLRSQAYVELLMDE
jgi:hypothetical protein